MIAGLLGPDQQRRLIDTIDTRLADPLGSRVFAAGGEDAPAAERISVERGGIWPSINSTLVWGLSRIDRERAWRELKANTLHNHARTYPDNWVGVWSGPDCYLYSTSERPGEGFRSANQSMQAWPVGVLFPHSETLNAVLWSLGIEASAAGLRIDPQVPCTTWAWRSRTLSIEYGASIIAGSYTGSGPEFVRLIVTLPPAWHGKPVLIEGADRQTQTLPAAGCTVDLLMPATGQDATFAIRLAPPLPPN